MVMEGKIQIWRGDYKGRQEKEVNNIMAQNMVSSGKEWFEKAIYRAKRTRRVVLGNKKSKNSATLCLTNNQFPGIIPGGLSSGKNQGGALCKSRTRLSRGKGVNL